MAETTGSVHESPSGRRWLTYLPDFSTSLFSHTFSMVCIQNESCMVCTLFSANLDPMQLFKTIYFSDYSADSDQRGGLTVPFPEAEMDAFRSVEHLSSYTLRQMLGFNHYMELEAAANKAETAIAPFVRSLIKQKTRRIGASNSSDGAAALQATFRGGRGSPLHDWFPYLEGYSPEFVQSIFKEFAPDARTILDPFCGSGTTALVAALDGRRGLYSEVNPVCRHIIQSKAAALFLAREDKRRVAGELATLSDTLKSVLASTPPDDELRTAFDATFGDRAFFDKKSFDAVLRSRTLVDLTSRSDRLVSMFLSVAILRSLVSGSLLVRRGDLRFRTDSELTKNKPDFIAELRESLHIVASDLLDARHASGQVELVCDDARVLSSQITEPVDAIITSPPYLNGTNYFRNTKIELWFLRQLRTKIDLRGFRDKAITSGINDVTVGKTGSNASNGLPPSVADVVEKLSKSAYDQRIPMMVASYFKEMSVVVRQMRAVSHDTTTIAVDLGDSCYGDVWVPTHDIFCDLMIKAGFSRSTEVVLRERQSRDGRKLSQTLQVFKVARIGAAKATPRRNGVNLVRWNSFRETLPHQQGDMAKRNWGHSWHSMCSYQGKLKPSIASTLVDALLPRKSGRVLDPFSGVGTIPFEARLQGHTAFGFDISPAAVAITRAKLEPASHEAVLDCIDKIRHAVGRASIRKGDEKAVAAIRFNGPLSSYFHPKTLAEILAARAYFRRNPASNGSEGIVLACLLHILHGNRPYALSRRSHPITPFAPTGPIEYRPLMERLEAKVSRCLQAMPQDVGRDGRSYFQDATAIWPEEVADLDAIITSPPFFDSTRFHTANWMRLWFAGWEADDFNNRPATFVDERQKLSFELYDSIFKQGHDRLRRGGVLAVHLGKSAKCDMAAILREIGERHLALADSFVESVEHCESHGIRDKGTVTHHQYLLFRKR